MTGPPVGDGDQITLTVTLLQTLADPTRIRLLRALGRDELSEDELRAAADNLARRSGTTSRCCSGPGW